MIELRGKNARTNQKLFPEDFKERFEVFQRDKFTCRYCGRTVSDGAKLEIDHIIPESQGGEYVAENLLTACHTCKHAKADILLKPPELKTIMGSKIRKLDG